MAKEIRTRQVCKDIKALDKAKAAAGHMKHAYVRTRECAGNAQMQGQESETPADYAENRMAHGADRVIHEAVHPVRQQSRKKKNQRKPMIKQKGENKQMKKKIRKKTQRKLEQSEPTTSETISL